MRRSIHGERPGRSRDRRGRGPRGPMSLPGPFTPAGVPAHRLGRDRFDHLVGQILNELAPWFERETEPVQVAVEEAPPIPAAWDEPVPESTARRGEDSVWQVVLYRLPIITRADDPTGVRDAVWSVLLHRLAEIWQMSPDDLDPR